MIVKVCGLTCLEDALDACEAGADMLGFNFHPPSPRVVDRTRCAQIVTALRAAGVTATMVGVFVDTPVEEIEAVLEACGLDLAQLSGDEPPGVLSELGGRAYKALRVRGAAAAMLLAESYPRRSSPPGLLMDAALGDGQFGGSGRTGDWEAARVVAARFPILLAGGLRPDNVAAAVATVQPWGVDVASGVERSPGRKELELMRAFVKAAHGR